MSPLLSTVTVPDAPARGDRLLEVAMGGSLVAVGSPQKVDGVTRLVDCSVKVFPLAAHFEISLVRPPARANRALVPAKGFLEQRRRVEAAKKSNSMLMMSFLVHRTDCHKSHECHDKQCHKNRCFS
jgi:hypothetical protein